MDGSKLVPTRKSVASIVAALVLGLAAVASAGDEPKDEGAAKARPAESPEKPKSSGIHLDTINPDVPADTQAERLKRMHRNIESHLSKAERKVFEQNESNYPNGNDRETFYQSVCDDLEIAC